jgi:hypothetical protein
MRRKLDRISHLGVDRVTEAVDVHLVGVSIHCAHEALDVEVLVAQLQEELGVGCTAIRVCRKEEEALENLSRSEELRLQSEALLINSLH